MTRSGKRVAISCDKNDELKIGNGSDMKRSKTGEGKGACGNVMKNNEVRKSKIVDNDEGVIETIHTGETKLENESENECSDAIPIYPIRKLSPCLNEPWSFVAYVAGKNAVKFWKNLSSTGKLFDIFVIDESGDGIRVVIFNEAVDKFEEMVKSGHVYLFSHGRIKHVNPAFHFEKISFEVSFSANCNIREVHSKWDFNENEKYTVVKDLCDLKSGDVVNLVGIVLETGSMKSITTKSGKNIVKRDLFLVDDSNKKVLCTCWGQVAEERFDLLHNYVVMIKSAKVNDYRMRRSLSVGVGAILFHDVALPRAKELLNWFQSLKSHEFDEIQPNMIGDVQIEAFKSH